MKPGFHQAHDLGVSIGADGDGIRKDGGLLYYSLMTQASHTYIGVATRGLTRPQDKLLAGETGSFFLQQTVNPH